MYRNEPMFYLLHEGLEDQAIPKKRNFGHSITRLLASGVLILLCFQ